MKRWATYFFAAALFGTLLFHAVCNQTGGGSGTGSGSGGSTSGGSSPGGSSSACTLSGAGTGPSGNNPSDFPNAAGINFAAFPVDPGNCTGTHTFYVATTGSDGNPGTASQPFRSILHALESAAGGDAVIVSNGTYSESDTLTLDKPNLRLCAAGGESVTVTPASSSIHYGLIVAADGVLIDGIHTTGFLSSITLSGNSGALVSNIILKNLTVTAGGTDFKDGITAPAGPVNNLLIKNVLVKNATLGISCNNGPCKNWRLDGVSVCNDANDVGGSGGDAIAIEAQDADPSTNILISNAEVTGASADGIDVKGTHIAVFNANVHDNLRNGVKFWRGGDLVNSFVVGHGADAEIVFDQAGTYRIVNSLIAYQNVNTDGTLRADSYTMTVCYDHPSDACPVSIINSVFFNNAGSIFLTPGTTATIQNNLLGNSLNDIIIEKNGTSIQETDSVSTLSSIATASENLAFTTNPGYANAGGRDFTFGAASPLKNAGTVPASFPSYDFRGNSRNQGGAPDLGPLELF